MSTACADKVALVTGASQGGTSTAIAVRLAAEGARVAITARSVQGLESTRQRIVERGGECVVFPADLSDPRGGRAELIARTRDALGPVDILVNNAAVNGYKPFETVTAKELERSLQVNLWAPWELMAAAVPGMRERAAGAILNLTTFSAELPPGPPFPTSLPAKGGSMYGAAKAALNRLTMAVASECDGEGIAVNALTPQAAIATPALVAGGWIDDIMFEPLDTMAEAALALCTADAEFLTGAASHTAAVAGRAPTTGLRPARRQSRRRLAACRPAGGDRTPGGVTRIGRLAGCLQLRAPAQPAPLRERQHRACRRRKRHRMGRPGPFAPTRGGDLVSRHRRTPDRSQS